MDRRSWLKPATTRPTVALALVLVGVLILHALFSLALWYEMRPKPQHLAVAPADQPLIVRLIDLTSTPPATQPTAPPVATPATPLPARPAEPPRDRPRPVTHEKPHNDAMVVQDHEAAPAPPASVSTPSTANLFAKDGSVKLAPPTAAASAIASAQAKPTGPADDRQIMQHDSNRMHYKATRFEKYFPPPNETLGGAVGRHIGNAIGAIAKSICDPKEPHHGFNPLCSTPPMPPSPKDGDERLSVPPQPLAKDPNPPKGPPLSSCIAEYKSNHPLAYGCPLNTPELAFKADLRECIDLFRAGKRLKPWCPTDIAKRAATESTSPATSTSTDSH